MTIITEYPLWFIIFCIIAGFLYASILYRRNKDLNEIKPAIIRLMAVSRFLLITLLCFFLLSPLIKSINRTVEKPVIVIAQDNSESVKAGKDSVYYKKEYITKFNTLIEQLSDKYDVRTYSFADKIKEQTNFDSIQFNEKQTDIASVFDEIETRYSNRNVGAIILASDGIYNKGANPLYAADKIKSPIYTIALGDTAVKKDLILMKVNHNRITYLGNKFPLEVVINARQLQGKTSTLTINKGDNVIFTQDVNITNNSFFTTIPVYLDAKEAGLQHYKVQLSDLPQEMSKANNSMEVFVEVLDARQKVLILTDAPHPDIGAIKQSIENNQNYEVESYMLNDFTQSLKKYNLVILYQLPNERTLATKIVNEIKADNIPVWVISGAASVFKSDLSFAGANQKTNEVEPVIVPNFPLFTISDELRKGIKDFPAIVAPFGTYTTEGSSNSLLEQRIGIVDTKTPLLYFNTIGEQKVAILQGEGIWRWRLFDFAKNGNHNLFDELISKTVQFLSTKMDKSFFRINSKSNFLENEPVEMEAEVYNQSYELINEPEVNITITNKENKKFLFSFNKTINAYHLNAGTMSVGEYKYQAQVKVGDKIYTQNGVFSISPLQVELTNTIADHQLLYTMAKKHNAQMLYPNDLDKLAEILNKREDIKSISFSEKKLTDLINLKWIFFFLLALISLEWFLRKRNGTY